MNVTLLRCPSPFLIDEKVFPPLGLMAVGTSLQEQGCSVRVADAFFPGTDWYGIGPTTPEYPLAKIMLQEVRSRRPTAKAMIGGHHASLYPEKCRGDGFNLVVVGDGEGLQKEMLLAGGIVRPPALPLDSYPIIDRTLVSPSIHEYHYAINGVPATSLVTAKGCPYRCGFCSKHWTGVRVRSADHVIREIDQLYYDWGYKALMFFDDIFILRPDRVRKICACLKSREIVWRCFVRADLVVKGGQGLMRCMAESGCVEVLMGVESGSDAILKAINKGETVSDIRLATTWLDDHGIRVKGLFIVGLPGESPETLGETERLVNDLPFAALDFTIFQPYAGSPIYENKRDYDIDWEALSWDDSYYKGRPGEYRCKVWTSSLTPKELEAARDDLEQQYSNIKV